MATEALLGQKGQRDWSLLVAASQSGAAMTAIFWFAEIDQESVYAYGMGQLAALVVFI